MIIKIIPETDEEKNLFKNNFSTSEIIHNGVKEYFVFGNKDQNKELIDFHEWAGSPRYIMGSLRYFFEVINDERRMREERGRISATPIMPQAQKIRFPNKGIPQTQGELENGLRNINHHRVIMENRSPTIIKKGEITPIQTIDISNLIQDDKKDNNPLPNVPNIDAFHVDDDIDNGDVN